MRTRWLTTGAGLAIATAAFMLSTGAAPLSAITTTSAGRPHWIHIPRLTLNNGTQGLRAVPQNSVVTEVVLANGKIVAMTKDSTAQLWWWAPNESRWQPLAMPTSVATMLAHSASIQSAGQMLVVHNATTMMVWHGPGWTTIHLPAPKNYTGPASSNFGWTMLPNGTILETNNNLESRFQVWVDVHGRLKRLWTNGIHPKLITLRLHGKAVAPILHIHGIQPGPGGELLAEVSGLVYGSQHEFGAWPMRWTRAHGWQLFADTPTTQQLTHNFGGAYGYGKLSMAVPYHGSDVLATAVVDGTWRVYVGNWKHWRIYSLTPPFAHGTQQIVQLVSEGPDATVLYASADNAQNQQEIWRRQRSNWNSIALPTTLNRPYNVASYPGGGLLVAPTNEFEWLYLPT